MTDKRKTTTHQVVVTLETKAWLIKHRGLTEADFRDIDEDDEMTESEFPPTPPTATED